MSESNLGSVLMTLAAVGISLFYLTKIGDLQSQLSSCNSKFESFKDGIIYGK